MENQAEVVTQTEENDDDFAAGFAGTPTETPEPKEPEVKEEIVEEAAAPKYVQITEDEWKSTRERAAKVDEIEAKHQQQFDKAFGTIGGMQRMLNQLQAKGVTSVSAEDFEELNEFPEISAGIVSGLNRALAKMGAGTAQPTPQVDPETIKSMVATEAEKIVEMKTLTRAHKDWKEIAVSADFEAWKAQQADDVRERLNESWDSEFLSEQLTKFKESKKPKELPAEEKKPKVNERQSRFAEAVTPRGTGGHATKPDVEDEFEAGFSYRKSG